jgi:hypothetical protein
MPENPNQKSTDDRDRQAQEPAQTTDIAAVQRQIQAGETGGSRQHTKHAARDFWQVPGASESWNPEPKGKRREQHQQQQDRDGFGFSF